MSRFRADRHHFERISRNVYVLVLIYRDPRVPWYAKAIAGLCVGYVFSPVQLMPDFIPILGWIDDAVVLAAGMSVLIKLTPQSVLTECRKRASTLFNEGAGTSMAMRWVMVMIVTIWLLLLIGSVLLVRQVLH